MHMCSTRMLLCADLCKEAARERGSLGEIWQRRKHRSAGYVSAAIQNDQGLGAVIIYQVRENSAVGLRSVAHHGLQTTQVTAVEVER